MSLNESFTLDSSVKGNVSAAFPLTTETKIGLYVFSKSGGSNNHRVGLLISPNGQNWIDHPASITGQGYILIDVVAVQVKVKVFKEEGKASNINVHLLAR